MFQYLDQETMSSLELEHLPGLRQKKTWFEQQIARFAELIGASCTPGQAYSDVSHGRDRNAQILEWLSADYIKLNALISRLELKHGTQ